MGWKIVDSGLMVEWGSTTNRIVGSSHLGGVEICSGLMVEWGSTTSRIVGYTPGWGGDSGQMVEWGSRIVGYPPGWVVWYWVNSTVGSGKWHSR